MGVKVSKFYLLLHVESQFLCVIIQLVIFLRPTIDNDPSTLENLNPRKCSSVSSVRIFSRGWRVHIVGLKSSFQVFSFRGCVDTDPL